MSSRWPMLFFAATFVASAAKSAEPPAVGTLTVSGAEASCPSSALLEARVDRLLGTPGETRGRMQAAGIGASVRFFAEGSGHRADIELHGARGGRRTLSDDGTDCRELAEAAALTLAILIDPSFVPPTDSASAASAPTGNTPATSPPSAPAGETSLQPVAAEGAATASLATRPVLPPAARPTEPTSASLFAGAGIASRLTRPLVPALSGGAAFDFSSRFGVRAFALWILPSAVEISPGKVELEVLMGSLEACVHFPPRTPGFRLSTCAGMSAGAIYAAGQGYRQDLATRQGFYAVQAGISGDLPAGEPIGFWLDARGYVPLTPYEFEVSGAGTVKPSKIPGLSAILGLRLRLF